MWNPPPLLLQTIPTIRYYFCDTLVKRHKLMQYRKTNDVLAGIIFRESVKQLAPWTFRGSQSKLSRFIFLQTQTKSRNTNNTPRKFQRIQYTCTYSEYCRYSVSTENNGVCTVLILLQKYLCEKMTQLSQTRFSTNSCLCVLEFHALLNLQLYNRLNCT